MVDVGLVGGIIVILITVVIIAYYQYKGYLSWTHCDPYSTESTVLTNQYDISRKWRAKKLAEVSIRKTPNEKVLTGVVGEFGEGMYLCVKHALEDGFIVNMVSGNSVYNDRISQLTELMEKHPNTFNYYIVNSRPKHHFLFIGRDNLFIEVPHEVKQEVKESIGLNGAKPEIIKKFTKEFSRMLEGAQKADVNMIRQLQPIY